MRIGRVRECGGKITATNDLLLSLKAIQGALGPAHLDSLVAATSTAAALLTIGKPVEARVLIDQVVWIFNVAGAGNSVHSLRALGVQGEVLIECYETDKAIEQLRYVAKRLSATEGVTDEEACHMSVSVCHALLARADALSEARKYMGHLKAELKKGNRTLPDGRTTRDRIETMGVYILQAQIDTRDAHDLAQESASKLAALEGEHSQAVIAAKVVLAEAKINRGDLKGAKKLLEKVCQTCYSKYSAMHPLTINVENNLGRILLATGARQVAKALLTEVLKRCAITYGPMHYLTAVVECNLGEAMLATHEPAEAELHFRNALVIQRIGLSAIAPDAIKTLFLIAVAREKQDDKLGAHQLRLEANQLLSQVEGRRTSVPAH